MNLKNEPYLNKDSDIFFSIQLRSEKKSNTSIFLCLKSLYI